MWEADLRDIAVTLATTAKAVAWGTVPEGKPLPFVALTVVSGDRNNTYQGGDGSGVNRVQVDAWANTLLDAKALTEALAPEAGGGLNCFRGVHGDTNFTGIYVAGEATGYEETEAGVIYYSRIELMVHHSKPED